MFSHILVPLDGSESAEAAIPPAVAIARAHGAALLLVVVTQLSRVDPVSDTRTEAEHRRYEQERMQPMATRVQQEVGVPVRALHLSGTDAVAVALAESVATEDVDLVMMTTHGRTRLSRAWSGSVADELVHLVGAPVLMLRRHGAGAEVPLGHFRRVLVALDGSRAAEAALEPALAVATSGEVQVILGRVVAPVPLEFVQAPGVGVTDMEATGLMVDEAHQYLATLASHLQHRVAMDVATVTEVEPTGFPISPTAASVAMLALRERADLVALTTHLRGSSRLLFSSVADRLLRDTDCALLVCHEAGVPAEESSAHERSAGAVAA